MKRWQKRFLMLLIAGLVSFHSNFSMALDKDFMYDSGNVRDPFLPLIGKGVILADMEELAIEDLTLEGIIYDPGHGSFAMINGDAYREGEYIGGFGLKEVQEHQIRLEKDDVVFTIKLLSEQ